MMPFDRYFYNETLGNYTVDTWLESLQAQHGGIDSVLLWPTYTNIGTDDRNQFELIEAMPGGIAELKRILAQLHSKGIHGIWPYNPWDQGTSGGDPANRTHAGASDAKRLSALLADTDSDGFFGDTISSSGLEGFFDDSVKDGRPAAIQPEGGGTVASMNFTSMGWGYWREHAAVPTVDLLKWLEPRWLTQGIGILIRILIRILYCTVLCSYSYCAPSVLYSVAHRWLLGARRWLTQVCDRWSRDKTDFIQVVYSDPCTSS
jgi:hypothetical protein